MIIIMVINAIIIINFIIVFTKFKFAIIIVAFVAAFVVKYGL
jgi:hypothetical protein